MKQKKTMTREELMEALGQWQKEDERRTVFVQLSEPNSDGDCDVLARMLGEQWPGVFITSMVNRPKFAAMIIAIFKTYADKVEQIAKTN